MEGSAGGVGREGRSLCEQTNMSENITLPQLRLGALMQLPCDQADLSLSKSQIGHKPFRRGL